MAKKTVARFVDVKGKARPDASGFQCAAGGCERSPTIGGSRSAADDQERDRSRRYD